MKNSNKKRNTIIGALLTLAVIGGYWGGCEVRDRAVFINLEVVEPGRLIRSAQPKPGDLDLIKKEHGLGTILCLRGRENEDVVEWAKSNGVKTVGIKMRADDPPTLAQVGLFFDMMNGHTVVLDRYRDTIAETVNVRGEAIKFPLPVLIHCQGGSDRAGVMVAMYRMAFQGWDLDRTKRDMTGHFHIWFMHPDQFRFLEDRAHDISPDYGSRRVKKKNAQKGG